MCIRDRYKGERAETRIGHRNRVREFVTIHRGTQGGGLVTAIGSDNLLMAYAHVAHDALIGANRIGLERRGFESPVIEALQTAFRLLTRAKLNTRQAVERIRAEVPPY